MWIYNASIGVIIMNKIYRYNELGKGNYSWLKTSYHFSFANYYNSNKVHLGPLRVINDDYIAPHTGFDTHPHNDMEIITYIVSGTLTHKDSMGNEMNLGPGGVQYMSAGTGITHSEHNKHDEELHLYQIWLFPTMKNLKPNYGDITFEDDLKKKTLLKMVGSHESQAVIKINQHASIEAGKFDKDTTVTIDLENFSNFYLIVIDGEFSVGDDVVKKGDALEGDSNTILNFNKESHVLMIKV